MLYLLNVKIPALQTAQEYSEIKRVQLFYKILLTLYSLPKETGHKMWYIYVAFCLFYLKLLKSRGQFVVLNILSKKI